MFSVTVCLSNPQLYFQITGETKKDTAAVTNITVAIWSHQSQRPWRETGLKWGQLTPCFRTHPQLLPEMDSTLANYSRHVVYLTARFDIGKIGGRAKYATGKKKKHPGEQLNYISMPFKAEKALKLLTESLQPNLFGKKYPN